jgi:hypothetical protein
MLRVLSFDGCSMGMDGDPNFAALPPYWSGEAGDEVAQLSADAAAAKDNALGMMLLVNSCEQACHANLPFNTPCQQFWAA